MGFNLKYFSKNFVAKAKFLEKLGPSDNHQEFNRNNKVRYGYPKIEKHEPGRRG